MHRFVLFVLVILSAGLPAAETYLPVSLKAWSKAYAVSFTIEYLVAIDDPHGKWTSRLVPATADPVVGESAADGQRRLEQGLGTWLVVPTRDQRTWRLIDRALVTCSPLDAQVRGLTFDGYACNLVAQLIETKTVKGLALPVAVAVSGGKADVGTGPYVSRAGFDGRVRDALTIAQPDASAPAVPIQWIAECRPAADGTLTATMLFTGGKAPKPAP